MASFTERCYWHTRTYGRAYRVTRTQLITGAVIGCIVTPFTNWLIPLMPKIIREDVVFRY